MSTFQCSLRPDPAAAGACVVGGYLSVFWDRMPGLRFADGLRFLGGVVLLVWRWGWVAGGGSAGSVLRSQGTSGQEELSRCRARGD